MLTNKRLDRILEGVKPLNELLAEWRSEVKLSKAEAARKCRLSPQMWQHLEDGDRALLQGATFLKLHEGTGIPLERLLVAADMLREKRLALVTA